MKEKVTCRRGEEGCGCGCALRGREGSGSARGGGCRGGGAGCASGAWRESASARGSCPRRPAKKNEDKKKKKNSLVSLAPLLYSLRVPSGLLMSTLERFLAELKGYSQSRSELKKV